MVFDKKGLIETLFSLQGEVLVSHPGLSQYGAGGPSTCGLAAANFARILLRFTEDNKDPDSVLRRISSYDTMKVCLAHQNETRPLIQNFTKEILSICSLWSTRTTAHLEVDDIMKISTFRQSMEDTFFSHGYLDECINTIRSLEILAPEKKTAVAIITRTPEIIACAKIYNERGNVYAIFDSHPRPEHSEGAGITLFAALDTAIAYVSKLMSVDIDFNDDGFESNVHLLSQFSIQVYIARANPHERLPGELDLFLELLGQKDKLSQLSQEKYAWMKEKKALEQRSNASASSPPSASMEKELIDLRNKLEDSSDKLRVLDRHNDSLSRQLRALQSRSTDAAHPDRMAALEGKLMTLQRHNDRLQKELEDKATENLTISIERDNDHVASSRQRLILSERIQALERDVAEKDMDLKARTTYATQIMNICAERSEQIGKLTAEIDELRNCSPGFRNVLNQQLGTIRPLSIQPITLQDQQVFSPISPRDTQFFQASRSRIDQYRPLDAQLSRQSHLMENTRAPILDSASAQDLHRQSLEESRHLQAGREEPMRRSCSIAPPDTFADRSLAQELQREMLEESRHLKAEHLELAHNSPSAIKPDTFNGDRSLAEELQRELLEENRRLKAERAELEMMFGKDSAPSDLAMAEELQKTLSEEYARLQNPRREVEYQPRPVNEDRISNGDHNLSARQLQQETRRRTDRQPISQHTAPTYAHVPRAQVHQTLTSQIQPVTPRNRYDPDDESMVLVRRLQEEYEEENRRLAEERAALVAPGGGLRDDDDMAAAERMQREYDEEDRHLAGIMSGLRDEQAPEVEKFSCVVCMDDHSIEHRAIVAPCNHVTCRDCLRQQIESTIHANAFPIHCPSCGTDGQRSEIGDDLVQQVGISEEDYVRFQQLVLASFSVDIECPGCKQSFKFDREEFNALKEMSCPLNCGYIWCKVCNQALRDGEEHSCDGQKELDRLAAREGLRACPACGRMYFKSSGCNHMTCTTPGCLTHFCYTCGANLYQGNAAPQNIYEHWNHCSGGVLFDASELAEQEESHVVVQAPQRARRRRPRRQAHGA